MTEYRKLDEWENKRYETVKADAIEALEQFNWSKESLERDLSINLDMQAKLMKRRAKGELVKIEEEIRFNETLLADAIEKITLGAKQKNLSEENPEDNNHGR